MSNELFINGEPAESKGVTSSGIGTVSQEQSELDSLMMEKDEQGNLRFTTDPSYRHAMQQRAEELTATIKREQNLSDEQPLAMIDDRDPMTKVIDNDEMLDFLEATDRYGRNRMSSDPDYRASVYAYFERKHPESAEDYHEVIE